LQSKWQAWKKQPIFAKFIEPSRNRLLKEYEGGLSLIGQEGASAAAGRLDGQRDWWFDASRLKDIDGEPLLQRFREALAFWDSALAEIEFISE
jgi:hypothetical protein